MKTIKLYAYVASGLASTVLTLLIASGTVSFGDKGLDVTMIAIALGVSCCFSLMIGSIEARGRYTLPKDVLRVGAVVKVADGDFYSPSVDHHIIPMFILNFKSKPDWTDPTYIMFNQKQLRGDGEGCDMRRGYNFVWNGEKLVSMRE